MSDELELLKWKPVQSSNLKRVAYDRENKALYVDFWSGVYRYDDVPRDVFTGLLEADSPGRYMNWLVKHDYEVRRVA